MICGNLVYNKILKNEKFECLRFYFLRNCWIFGNVFLYCWCDLYYKLLLLMRLSDYVSFSVYEYISKIVFDIF